MVAIDTNSSLKNFSSVDIHPEVEAQTVLRIERFMGAGAEVIDKRIKELEREISVERLIELEAPLVTGTGALLAYFFGRKFLAIPAFSASMVLLHGLKGVYPLMPVFRKLGVRTQNEILTEKNALKVLRGDHLNYLRNDRETL